jgi:hypothetical protein
VKRVQTLSRSFSPSAALAIWLHPRRLWRQVPAKKGPNAEEQGAKPGDLPIQRPERFDLMIDLKIAKALGLDIPTQLQQLADEVIE